MKLQFDHQKRVVALSNLEAMCDRISGMCHKFSVVKVTQNRVYVEYSNPDEYGNARPIQAVFPAYPGYKTFDADSMAVVLDAIRYTNCTGIHEEDWQAFEQLYACPVLWRTNKDSNDWKTEDEIKAEKK